VLKEKLSPQRATCFASTALFISS